MSLYGMLWSGQTSKIYNKTMSTTAEVAQCKRFEAGDMLEPVVLHLRYNHPKFSVL